LVMWGEEDAPTRRDDIPSSQFSSDSSPPATRRPARRSNPSNDQRGSSNTGGGGGWYDDENDGITKQRPAKTSSNDGGDDWFNDNDDSGSGKGGYAPYVYDKIPSSNRGRGGGGGQRDSYQRDGGRGRGGRGGGRGGGGDRSRGRGRFDGGGGGDRDYRRDDSRGGGRGGRGGGSYARGGGSNRGDSGGRGDRRAAIEDGEVKTNLRMIENAGYQHLYGIAPVLNALKANVRDFVNPKVDLMAFQDRLSNADGINDDDFSMPSEEESSNESSKKKIIKPEAMLSPHLFMREGALDDNKRSYRSNAKKDASAEILALAKENEIPIAEVDKGVLNTLCGNRPHQGFVLRCGGLDFETVRKLPVASEQAGPSLWLALDEVVDPQNLGALLRSAYFLGSGPGLISDDDESLEDAIAGGKVGILVCSKNSSPLTPTVSAASAGALEFMTIYSTSNLPKLLNGAKEDGWRILGAAAEVPDGVRDYSNVAAADTTNNDDNDWDVEGDDNDDAGVAVEDESVDTNTRQGQQCLDLHKVETGSPTILVLGSEGRGLRTLVARSCTEFVSIPGGLGGATDVTSMDDDDDESTQAGVDSLNVSVTGGILLWHFLSSSKQ